MSGQSTWAVVPVKALGEAKQRLAAVLPLEARRKLVLVMLQDVLAALRQVERLGPVLVVTPDAFVAELAESNGTMVLREEQGRGHSAAATAGLTHALVHGALQALTLPADVPLVTPDELRSVVAAAGVAEGPRATLVPSRDGDGTNALLIAPPDALEPSFGPGSFARHVAQAEARRIGCRVLHLPGLGTDIDEPRDLLRLIQEKQGCKRYGFLEAHRSRLLETTVGADQQ